MWPDNIRENPLEPTGGMTSSPAPTVSTTVQPTTTPSTPAVTPTSTPAGQPSGTVTTTPATQTGTQTATPVTPAAPSWLDSMRTDGFQTQETDEAKVRRQLIQAHQDAERLRPLAPHVSAYQQHATQFHAWLAEQNKKPAAPAAEADWTAEFYTHPEWNPNWKHQVTTDAQGNLVAVPGAPADIVHRYQSAQAFRQEQVEKFLTNPFKFMEPAIRKIAGEISSKQSDQGVSQYKQQQEAKQFVSQHSNWLFERGQDGGIKTSSVINPQTGRYESQQVLSQYGQQFVQHLQEAERHGLPPALQQDYALKAVQNAYMASPEYTAYLIAQQSQQAAPAAGAATPAAVPQTARQQANGQFLAKANPAIQPAPVGGNAVPTTPKVTRENLEQVMLSRLREAGATV